ncbi:hypothetical protein TRFO_37899 [Tritrichomonas foetus]|uniref:Initiator binding domain-containing protein n=1 Tax=Tritrichomonas foetus TaxID=1144522 RepID=A0A1J4J9X8_9EUKA|nr:hypothetical protein TRFO_37899 [Tritrichomonas foetus]|eukprot:OHS95960.1 hypothetical protein TRFO_37899 [Tritrichomonas foetus]
MEIDRNEASRFMKMSKNETRAGEILQNEFLRLRQIQEKNKTSTKISDVFFIIAKYVNNNVYNPVPVLKSLGILFFGRTIALNLSILPALLICCRAKTIISLHKEGWEDVKSDQDTNLASIVGMNDVKNWAVYNVPQKTPLSEYLEENQRIIATEQSFGLNHAPEEILIGPGLPPQNILTEPHFPLVSIQYELTFDNAVVADAKPTNNSFSQNLELTLKQKKTGNFQISHQKEFYIDASAVKK